MIKTNVLPSSLSQRSNTFNIHANFVLQHYILREQFVGKKPYETFNLSWNFYTSRKRAIGLDPLVPASIWAGTKGPATSPQIRQPPGRL
jgi:hypothetical protein